MPRSPRRTRCCSRCLTSSASTTTPTSSRPSRNTSPPRSAGNRTSELVDGHPDALRRAQRTKLAELEPGHARGDAVGIRNRARTRGHAVVLPAAQHAHRQLFGHEREAEVIAPLPIDVEVATPQPLVAKPELLDHSQRRRVLRADADLPAVKTHLKEAVVGRERDGRRRDVLARETL